MQITKYAGFRPAGRHARWRARAMVTDRDGRREGGRERERDGSAMGVAAPLLEGEYPADTVPELGELAPSSTTDGGAALRARLAEQGYLYLPRLLPEADVLGLQADFAGEHSSRYFPALFHALFSVCSCLSEETHGRELTQSPTHAVDLNLSATAFPGILAAHDWIAPGQGPYGTETTPDRFNLRRLEGAAEYQPVFECFQQLESFHALAQQPALMDTLALVYEEPAFAHPRNIGRIIFPQQSDFKTQPHQDWFFIQGDQLTITAWVPLGAVAQRDGPLSVLAGSHRHGLRRHIPVAETSNIRGGAGGHTSLVSGLEAAGCRWLSTDYQPGDVLLFTSLTMHCALPNVSNHIRLSADYRYSPASKPLVSAGLLPHLSGLTWDQIYERDFSSSGWEKPRWQSDSRLKYYWRSAVPPLVEPLGPHPDSGENHSTTAEGLRIGDELPCRVLDGAERHAAIRASLQEPGQAKL